MIEPIDPKLLDLLSKFCEDEYTAESLKALYEAGLTEYDSYEQRYFVISLQGRKAMAKALRLSQTKCAWLEAQIAEDGTSAADLSAFAKAGIATKMARAAYEAAGGTP